MLTDQFAQTLDTYGTARDERAQARQSAGAAFDLLFGQARLAGWWARLTGRSLALRALNNHSARDPRSPQTHPVPLAEIVGSENRAEDFDAEFRPLERHTRDRWISLAAARRLGVALPAVDLVAGPDGYYVRDGHHRISVARAAGQMEIEARIVSR
ncbi:MAG: hypothetical protein IT317_23070 [Anaerolineales bacterium]|nr:hypothetical protein [Anaerolineales bacterium]